MNPGEQRKRLKYCVDLINEKAEGVNADEYIGLENVQSGTGLIVESAEPVVLEGQANKFKAGDVLFGKLRPYLAKVVRAARDGHCTSELLVLRPRLLDQGFAFYSLLNPTFISLVDSSTYGSKMPRASWEFIGNQMQWIPPLPEQCAIAEFLDRKTAEIDAVVTKKERLIDLLREERQVLINRAVTRGLDAGVPMQDSGIEWLGKIPAHWQTSRIKWVAALESGHTPDKKIEAYWTNCTIPWVSLNDTGFLKTNDYITETAFRVNELGLANSSARLLPARAVVFSRDATIGRCAITTVPAAVSQHFIAWLCGPRLVPEYLLHVLRSMTQELERLTMGATLKTIGMPDVKTLAMPVPPLAEQRAICDHIDRETGRIDGLIAKNEEQIAKLREYRAALISAAVTGKLAVTAQPTIAPKQIVTAQPAVAVPVPEPAKKPANAFFRRSVFAAEIIDRLHDEPTFGHVKFQKVFFVAQHHLQVGDFEENYHRQAAGPHDNKMIRSVDSQLEKQRWFAARPTDGRYVYEKLAKAGGHRQYFDRYFGQQAPALGEVLALFRTMTTEQAEIVATLYAVWNDFLILCEPFDDARIIDDVLNNWHESKQKIGRDRWQKALGWMREKGLVPHGFGKPTRQGGSAATAGEAGGPNNESGD